MGIKYTNSEFVVVYFHNFRSLNEDILKRNAPIDMPFLLLFYYCESITSKPLCYTLKNVWTLMELNYFVRFLNFAMLGYRKFHFSAVFSHF